MAIRIDARSYNELSPDEVAESQALGRLIYPKDQPVPGSELHWAPLDPAKDQLVRLWEDERLVSTAFLTQRRILVAGEPALVAGVRGVRTHPDARRRGHAATVMRRIHELIDSLEPVDFGMLFSSEMAASLYASLGWRPIPGPVWIEGPDGRMEYTGYLPSCPVMVRLPEGRPLPTGEVDILGLPW